MFDVRALRAVAEDWPASIVMRTVAVTAPAAGADWTLTCPGESVWAVYATTARFVTSAVVANRAPKLVITDGSNTMFDITDDVAITATLTTQISWLSLLGYQDTAIAAASLNIGTPQIVLQPGWTIGTVTSLIDVGDQWSRVFVNVVESFAGERDRERQILDQMTDRFHAIMDRLERRI